MKELQKHRNFKSKVEKGDDKM
uniref:Uncharacterized protein n=1 Tax=Anguilla anguilla TaxID=7936 RepID=A0A0E9W6Z7_ANGAN